MFLLIVLATVECGCATADKPLRINDLLSLSPLKVIRFETPPIKRYTWGVATKSLLLPTTYFMHGFFGGFGTDALATMDGMALRKKCFLPDYGQLVMNKFNEKVAKDKTSWPRMLIEDNPVQMEVPVSPIASPVSDIPVQKKYEYKSSNTLSFNVACIYLHDWGFRKGLYTSTIAEIHIVTGHLIWRKRSDYSQKKAGRERELEEIEANDCTLLKEGMDYAAEMTAEEFIEDIKRSGQR